MSGTIWLITEDENDYKIVKHIVEEKLGFAIKVRWRSPTVFGISRLAAQLGTLIKETRKLVTGNDCIVVLHDEDVNQRNRTHYNTIREICQSERVSLVVAKDEIEAWLLSDSGVSKWLKMTRVKTWNNAPKPSDDLKSLMNRHYKLPYPRELDRLLVEVAGDGINESFQDALVKLRNAPCIK